MRAAFSRDRVNGFLSAKGQKIVNERGEEVLLMGWGLGNWLNCEGYMWGLGAYDAFDRPRRIEATIENLCGRRYAIKFWRRFREFYISEEDIRLMAEMGYNSLRVPIMSRLLLKESPKYMLVEEGFEILEQLCDLCEKYGIYVFLDMHAAPGGQTGANIDDSADDLCRLLIDQAQFERGLDLWEEIAKRFRGRWIVGGYDLLNEPIRPVRFEGDPDLDMYTSRLKEFYTQAIARIRQHDPDHMISLEGTHWATDVSIFDHVYDPNMVLHFHRYGCAPELASLTEYLEVSKRLNIPLWLGETGENVLPWMSAMVPLASALGISVTLWPWKKSETDNSPVSITLPNAWQKLTNYLGGGVQPDEKEAQEIFDAFLQSLQTEKCKINREITPYLFRQPGCVLAGSDFDETIGPDDKYHAEGVHAPGVYRKQTGMDIVQLQDAEKDFPFDGPWRHAALRLHPGEWAEYMFYDVRSTTCLEIVCYAEEVSCMEVMQNGVCVGTFDVSGGKCWQTLVGMHLSTASECVIRLHVTEGQVTVREIRALPARNL